MSERPGVIRVAMWSGPRNISTALMRSFENRADTVVVDEPLYGPFLAHTGIDHPMRDDVIASQGTDWRASTEQLLAPVGDGVRVQYQKHMTHHLLPHMERDWSDQLVNCFLIRDPARVVASYARRRDVVTLADLGFEQQAEIFDRVAQRLGTAPPVVDAGDVLADPGAALGALCAAIGIDFDRRMLSWPSGPRDSDGVWAEHWYDSVWASTGFGPPSEAIHEPVVETREAQAILEVAEPIYRHLRAQRLTIAGDDVRSG